MINEYNEMKEFFSNCIELTEMGDYGYEWEIFKSYYHPESKKFYWAEASGCSCNCFEDFIGSLGDYNVGTKSEYLKDVIEFARDHDYKVDGIRREVFGL